MKGVLSQMVTDAAQSQKIAATVAATTTGTGISTIIELIPTDIGKVAPLIGIMLSSVLIYTHIQLYRKKIKIMDKELLR